jgi:predicted Zn-dependent protease
LGQRAAPALERRFGGTFDDTALLNRLRYVGQRLAAASPELDRPWHYRLLASDRINAFSLPGGLIYITRGLCERRIGQDNDLLAAVIAHEAAHVMGQDSLKAGRRGPDQALEREISADRRAARYLSAAGYDARCLGDLLRLLKDVQPPGWANARIAAQAADGDT